MFCNLSQSGNTANQVAAAASTPDPNSVEAVAAVKQLVLSQIDKKLKDLREEGGIDQ